MITTEVEDLKLRRTYSICIVEDILTVRPFTKHVALLILQRNECVSNDWYDLIKLSRECLKNLTAEDLRQIYVLAGIYQMAEFENKYNDINGGTVENELSKIVLRYIKEAKPKVIIDHLHRVEPAKSSEGTDKESSPDGKNQPDFSVIINSDDKHHHEVSASKAHVHLENEGVIYEDNKVIVEITS